MGVPVCIGFLLVGFEWKLAVHEDSNGNTIYI